MRTIQAFLLLVAATASVHAGTYEVAKPEQWWQTAVLYEVWPQSFKDSDGDGIGDLNGITSKMEHFVDLGVTAIWIAPFYESPLSDMGYDIANFSNVNPMYGTLDDAKALIVRAHELGLKVFFDFVPNHISDEHEWYVKAKQGIAPYVDYFVWSNGTLLENGTRVPPSNWVDVFNGGSAWLWVEEREAYVLHQFDQHEIDLNYRCPLVIEETLKMLDYWLDLGVDGYRVDAAAFMVEDKRFPDEPESYLDYDFPNYFYLNHIYTMNQPLGFEVMRIWRDHIDNYTKNANDGVERVLFTETYVNMSDIVEWYNAGSHCPFNFFFIKEGQVAYPAVVDTSYDIVSIIDNWMSQMPSDKTANWVLGNHDMDRVATRFGVKRVDGMNFLLTMLPGIAGIYNGDELGMTNTNLTWEETTDVRACNMDEETYTIYSRDPVRTPYQWDNTTSAGYSTNSTTFLRPNPNYVTLNLAAQKEADISHYKNVQKAIALRNTTVVREGNLVVDVLEETVIAFARTLDGYQPIVVLINWEDTDAVVSLDELLPNSPYTKYQVLLSDIYSGVDVGTEFDCSSVPVPASGSMVLQGIDDTTTSDVDSEDGQTRESEGHGSQTHEPQTQGKSSSSHARVHKYDV